MSHSWRSKVDEQCPLSHLTRVVVMRQFEQEIESCIRYVHGTGTGTVSYRIICLLSMYEYSITYQTVVSTYRYVQYRYVLRTPYYSRQ